MSGFWVSCAIKKRIAFSTAQASKLIQSSREKLMKRNNVDHQRKNPVAATAAVDDNDDCGSYGNLPTV